MWCPFSLCWHYSDGIRILRTKKNKKSYRLPPLAVLPKVQSSADCVFIPNAQPEIRRPKSYLSVMMYEFLTPVDKENLLEGEELHPGQLGNYVFIYDGKEPELHDFNLAFIGICDDRGSVGNGGSSRSPDLVRKEFYKLTMPP